MPPFFFDRMFNMKKIILLMVLSCLCCGFSYALDKVPSSEYSLEITVKDIPKGQQTLFVPIMIDTMILDFDKVGLEGLSSSNILAVASTSMDKAGPGIGLIKFDEDGLPETLHLKVSLKPEGKGETTVSLVMVAFEDALPSKGISINNDVTVSIKDTNEIEVTEKVENGKKKLKLSQSKLTVNVQRQVQKEESIYVPVIFDKKVIDLDETFGHSIVGPGIAVKSISSSSLQEGASGIEILLTQVAEKDFSFDIDLVPRNTGKSKIAAAFPQQGRTSLVRGPVVDISPQTISVVAK